MIEINYKHREMVIALDALVGKWKPVILSVLYNHGTLRFNELKRHIPNITQRMLTLHLRELEDNDLVKRVIYPQIPPKVEYSLTEYAMTLKPLVKDLYEWGEKHIEHMENKQKSASTEAEIDTNK